MNATTITTATATSAWDGSPRTVDYTTDDQGNLAQVTTWPRTKAYRVGRVTVVALSRVDAQIIAVDAHGPEVFGNATYAGMRVDVVGTVPTEPRWVDFLYMNGRGGSAASTRVVFD